MYVYQQHTGPRQKTLKLLKEYDEMPNMAECEISDSYKNRILGALRTYRPRALVRTARIGVNSFLLKKIR